MCTQPFTATLVICVSTCLLIGITAYIDKRDTKDKLRILDNLLKNYEERERPCEVIDEQQGGICNPIRIKASVYLRTIDEFNDKTMDFAMQLTFRQSWRDTRLDFSTEDPKPAYLSLSSDDKQNRIWLPDTVFLNEKADSIHHMDKNNVVIRIASNGQVTYAFKASLTLSCRMDFKQFPRDSHQCSMDFSSYSYTVDYVLYEWNKTGAILMSPSFKTNVNDFELVDVKRDECKTETSMGSYSCLRLSLYVKRVFNFAQFAYLYMPGVVLVFVSWLSFWLDPQALISRMAICVLCLLALIIQIAAVAPSLPLAASYRSWDIWSFVCLLFLISSIVQQVVVNRMVRSDLRSSASTERHMSAHSTMPSMALSTQLYSPPATGYGESEHPLKIAMPKKSAAVSSKKSIVAPRTSERRISVQHEGQVAPLLDDSAKEEVDIKPRKANWVVRKWRECSKSQRFDVWCRIIFSAAFVFFNIMYWSH